MRFLLVSLAAWLMVSPALSQKSPVKFGDVSMDELKMSTYDGDTSAAAVIIFDKGETSLGEDLTVVLNRHIRVKVFSREGFDWADFSIRLSHATEYISKIRGVTYNLEGGVIVPTKMDDAAIFKSKFNKVKDQVKFTLPNVKEGSVIEYSYQYRSTASLVPDWQFQYMIPSMYSEYTVSIPGTFSFQKDLQGYLPISGHEQKGSADRYIMARIPAFKKEPHLASPQDYLSKLHFYISELMIPGKPVYKLTKTWGEIVEGYNDSQDFGGALNGSGFLKKTVEELTAGSTDAQKNMEAIYGYVKSNVEWNDFTDRIPDRSFKQVLDEKKGSSSEINLMLVSMLRKAGLVANPVFISTRDNGKVRSFITQVDQFNDVICTVKIGGKDVFLDATDRDLPITALPERCLNGSGMVLTKTGPVWVDITSVRSKELVTADLKIDNEAGLAGHLNISWSGLAGSDSRKAYKEKGEEKYLKEMTEGKTWEIAKSEFQSVMTPTEAMSEKHQVIIRDHAQVNGPLAYINPYVMERMEENAFKSQERAYPVDFATPFDKIYMAKIVIPDDYLVEELPKSKASVLPGNSGRFVYNMTQTGNVISFTSMITISKSVFLQDEYLTLREFYDQIIAKQAEQIVLKRK